MKDARVNAFDASISPPQGTEALSTYLSAICRALGGRNDAYLARVLGVPAPTIASWKRRGIVPSERASWFRDSLVLRIAEENRDLPQVDKTARASVVELVARSSGNPLQVERFPVLATSTYLGGLLALAQMLTDLKGVPPPKLSSFDVKAIADLLELAMPQFRLAAGPFHATEEVPQ